MAYNLLLRDGRYYYYRRVPKKFSHLDQRKFVRIALETANGKDAINRAVIYNSKIEGFWGALVLSGNAAGSEERYKATVEAARLMGFAYKSAADVARAPLDEILNRIEAANNEETIDVVLGGIEPPKINLHFVPEKYFTIASDIAAGKSQRWVKKWKNDRTAAMTRLISEVGNKAMTELDRTDALKLREYWRLKIAEGMNGDTANKNMRYCREMLQSVAQANQIKIDYKAMFEGLRFSVKVNSRPPFEAEYVQKILLPQIRDFPDDTKLGIFALSDTGMRPSELLRLTENDIRLDGDIPFVWIRGETKTDSSQRQIPLTGAALHAFRLRPKGFTAWSHPDSFTNIAGRYLKEYDLLPSSEHSLYSLRHTFKDRLRDIEAPAEIIDELMGHADDRPKYGRGHMLEKKLKWLNLIAFKVPD